MLPSREALMQSRSLQWLGPLLDRPWLWRFRRHSVAAGVGIGVFFGFLVPILQIALAALFAVVLRANLPVAAASTLVSNPFTYAPIYVAAYRVGTRLLGEPTSVVEAAVIEAEVQEREPLSLSWWQRFASVAKPVMLGLAVFAVIGGSGAYGATLLIWGLWIRVRLRRRRKRGSAR